MIPTMKICDLCKERGCGVEHIIRGTPVLFECRACAPRSFDFASQRLFGHVIAHLFSG